MDIKDFAGLTKYKMILPTLYVVSWVLMVAGPVFFEVMYYRYCLFFLIYIDIKLTMLFGICIYATTRAHRIMTRAQNTPSVENIQNKEQLNSRQEIYYGFIIPNFREDIEMLAETLDTLASHKRAQDKYLIFLAMEAHEEGCELKAE